ncbi:MAG: anhydro-N-acetylmuramic acid kinase [Bacteroidia bacterium]|nr:anhydro-N-acetylmuramic acid kinase [Bacteroidia bacterium]
MNRANTYLGIGSMSGTSMDGLDLAYVKFEVDGEYYHWELLNAAEIPFDEKWRSRLLHLAEQSAEVYAKTHVYLGHWYGEQLKEFINNYDLKPDFAAVHGQTIFHQPRKNFTAQIGDGETVASYLNCPVVSNFRNKDVALGGQGAPLVPLGEKYLFPDHELFLNLGGISNLTYGKLAYDISPCNGILNYIYEQVHPEAEIKYDANGEAAARGQVSEALKNSLDQLPYYHAEGPKSLGWEWVVQEVMPVMSRFELPYEDLLRTLVEHIAYQIGNAIRKQVEEGPEKMMVTGGGRHHTLLMDRIEHYLQGSGVVISNDFPESWIDYKEAIIFAFLGLRTLLGESTSLSTVTGASQNVLGGSIHLPPSWSRSLLGMELKRV